MRWALSLLLALAPAACAGDDGTRTYEFGPYVVAPGEELFRDCVQITLHNTEALHVNTVELTTGPGFHHSTWMFMPERLFPGEDGRFPCSDRDYSEPAAAVVGGVLFAQSTQAAHEVQAFPPGVAVKVPPRSKLIANIHVLNATDVPLSARPSLKLDLLPPAEVTTLLSGVAFQNQSIALPANRPSRFTLECDLAARHRDLLGTEPDFRIYYALAHYHDLGTGLVLEAVRPDGTASTVFATEPRVGDLFGGPITPLFDMTGHAKLRFSCDFYNPRADVVRWGAGDQEMCLYLAFTDSPYAWGGGVNAPEAPQNEVVVGGALHYSNPCAVFATSTAR
jgi:hypothetical protein